MALAVSTPSSSGPGSSSSWTETLKALPARDRISWQRSITADTATQSLMSKQGPFSRAYSSGGPAPASGILESSSEAGQRVSAVTRQFPSTADLLATALYDAFEKARVPLPASIVSYSLDPPSTDALKDAIQRSLRQASLDTSYRIVVSKALQRRLVADPEWAAEVAGKMPHGSEAEVSTARFSSLQSLADGSLVEALTSGNILLGAPRATGCAAGGGASPAAVETSVTLRDNLLDSAMDELLGEL